MTQPYYLAYRKRKGVFSGNDIMDKGYICVMQKRRWLWDTVIAHYSIYFDGPEKAKHKAETFLAMLEDLNVDGQFNRLKGTE